MFPLPISSVIFRALCEDAGHKWMEAIELSIKCTGVYVHKHSSNRDSVPTTPLSATTNGNNSFVSPNSVMLQSFNAFSSSIDRSDEDISNSQQHFQHNPLTGSRILFNDLEIEKHFGNLFIFIFFPIIV